jgi:hypothetical protein
MAMFLAPLILSLSPTAAQILPGPSSTTVIVPAPRHRGIFISPMGEPFRPNGREDDTLVDWFRQADRNHDGQLSLDEMQQDSDRFFAVLDVNHDGEIDPDEISRYEDLVAPEIGSGPHLSMAGSDDERPPASGAEQGNGHGGGGGGHHHGGHHDGGNWRGGGEDSDRGAARFGLLDLPEPVVSADADFNRGVSQSEFRQAAGQRFLALDLDHHGFLTLVGLTNIRPAPPPVQKKPSADSEAESAPPED